jgi:predicted DNA-binding transcriptional regulator AlpA
MPELLTMEDLTSRLRVSFATVRRMRSRGRLPAEIRISARSVRFQLNDVEDWEGNYPPGRGSLLKAPGLTVVA